MLSSEASRSFRKVRTMVVEACFEELKPINQSNLAMRNITTRASCIAVLLDVVDSKLADGPWIDRSTEWHPGNFRVSTRRTSFWPAYSRNENKLSKLCGTTDKILLHPMIQDRTCSFTRCPGASAWTTFECKHQSQKLLRNSFPLSSSILLYNVHHYSVFSSSL